MGVSSSDRSPSRPPAVLSTLCLPSVALSWRPDDCALSDEAVSAEGDDDGRL